MESADVVVVGAGAMGSATAWWLARRGLDVVVVEQLEQGHDRGSSHGRSRIFRLAYPDRRYVRLARAALPLWRELEDDAARSLLDTTGGIDHGPAPAIDALEAAIVGERVPHELLRPEAASERWPGMRFDRAVLFHPEAGRCRAEATVAACQERAVAHGADLRFGVGPATVTPTASGDGVLVGVGAIQWRAGVAVVAAGAWVAPLLAGWGDVHLPPLTVTLEQVQHFAAVDPGLPWPSFLHHREAEPLVYGLETPGEGVKVDEHHAGRVVDPITDDRHPDLARLAAVERYVEAWFPGLDPEPVHTSTCLYTTTSSEDFVIDRVGPIVVGSPCSGHGFKFVPLIGRMLADLADGTVTTADPRFALPARRHG
ncbi:MAG: FAD-dependent oxidoreductase [Acidimicrobiales bacterium]